MEEKEPQKKKFSEMLEENPKKVLKRICLAIIITASIIILFYFAIARYDGLMEVMDALKLIIQPFVIGFVMAFLMNPIMKTMEKPLNKRFATGSKNPKRTRTVIRVITSIIALIILLALITLCIMLIIPDIVSTVKDLSGSFGGKFATLLDNFNNLTEYRFNAQVQELRKSKFSEILEYGFRWLIKYFDLDDKSSLTSLASGAMTAGRILVNVIVGIFVSVYVLISKDVFRGQIKKIIYGTFKINHANAIMDVGRKTNEIFYGFIIGKIIDSIIIGILCYIGCLILKMPYAVLVSVIVGVTNVIPVFGPYIGAVPTVLLIFITDPIKGVTFLVFILLLQQLDGNFIGPKILGESTGISVFWVMVAIVIGGGLFGFKGMLLGVPVTAVIYYIVGQIAGKKVRKKNLPEVTDRYVELNHVDEETNEIVLNNPEDKEVGIGLFKGFKKKKKAKDIDEKKKSADSDEKKAKDIDEV